MEINETNQARLLWCTVVFMIDIGHLKAIRFSFYRARANSCLSLLLSLPLNPRLFDYSVFTDTAYKLPL